MTSGLEFEKEFKKILVKEYSENRVVPEYRLGNFMVDFAIINDTTKEIIAIFELKMFRKDAFSQPQLSGFNSRIKQLINANGIDIPVFYVIKDNENRDSITINTLDQERGTGSDTKFIFRETSLPSYNELLMQNSTNIVKKNKNILKESTSELRKICRFLAIIIFIIWLFCKCQKVEITWVDLAFISASAALLIFPYIKKIEINQLSIEFRNSEQKNQDK